MLRPSIFSNNFVDNMFDDLFDDSFMPTISAMPTMSAMPSQYVRTTGAMSTDVRETDNAYYIDMELPGFAKEDVQAELKDGYLTINAAHNENKEEKNKEGKFIRRERYTGSYQRSFYVGEQMTQEDIKAKFNNGILTVEVPKKEAKPEVEQKKYITIEG